MKKIVLTNYLFSCLKNGFTSGSITFDWNKEMSHRICPDAYRELSPAHRPVHRSLSDQRSLLVIRSLGVG